MPPRLLDVHTLLAARLRMTPRRIEQGECLLDHKIRNPDIAEVRKERVDGGAGIGSGDRRGGDVRGEENRPDQDADHRFLIRASRRRSQ